MEKDIGKIPKNDTTDIVIRVDDFGGRKGVTIREFVSSERYTGFTKSGVRILSPDFAKFKEMINSISDEDMKEEADAGEGAGSEAGKEKSEEKKSEPAAREDMPDY